MGSAHVVTGIGYAKHYGLDKLVVQLDNATTYQAGEFLEACKDGLLIGCKIIIERLILDVKTVTPNSRKRKLILLEDGIVYKIKKSKLEGQVSPGLTLP